MYEAAVHLLGAVAIVLSIALREYWNLILAKTLRSPQGTGDPQRAKLLADIERYRSLSNPHTRTHSEPHKRLPKLVPFFTFAL